MIKYKEFIKESNISDLFSSLHGAIDEKNLLKLSDYIKGSNSLSIKESDLKNAADYLGVSEDSFYYDPGNFVHPIIIWDGPLYYGIIGGNLSIDMLKNIRAKEFIDQSKRMIHDLTSKKNYGHLFGIMDKKILIPTFIKIYQEIPDKDKYDVFIDLYVRSEYGFQKFPKEIIMDCFSKRNLSKEWKKNIEKLKKKLQGKDKITVYRGIGSLSAKEDDAFSWTLSKKTAKFFADRFGSNGKIIKKEISIEEIVDYLDNRGEEEIILIPKKYQ
jgi:hypothetical protein